MVRLFQLLRRIGSHPSRMIELMPPPPFDISKATKLKEVEFRLVESNTQWIVTTLQTARIENPQPVTIAVSAYALSADLVGETTRREWQDLNHALDRLWTSHPIRPTVTFGGGKRGVFSVKLASELLPKIASKGAVKWRVAPGHP